MKTGLARRTRIPVSASVVSSRPDPRRLLLATDDLVEPPARDDVRVVDVAGRREEPRALLERERTEKATVAHDLLEHVGRQPQPLSGLVVLDRSCAIQRG